MARAHSVHPIATSFGAATRDRGGRPAPLARASRAERWTRRRGAGHHPAAAALRRTRATGEGARHGMRALAARWA